MPRFSRGTIHSSSKPGAGARGARPKGETRRGGDRGVDGVLYFHDSPDQKTKRIVLSVKAGKVLPTYLRDLRGVVDRDAAKIGVLISFQEPSAGMRAEAAEAGFYESPLGAKHPRLQLLTVESPRRQPHRLPVPDWSECDDQARESVCRTGRPDQHVRAGRACRARRGLAVATAACRASLAWAPPAPWSQTTRFRLPPRVATQPPLEGAVFNR